MGNSNGNEFNGFILDVILVVGKAFLTMLIWNNLIATEIGLDKISFAGAIGISLIFKLYSDWSYSDVKAIQADMTVTPFYNATLLVEFVKVAIVVLIGAVAYFLLK